MFDSVGLTADIAHHHTHVRSPPRVGRHPDSARSAQPSCEHMIERSFSTVSSQLKTVALLAALGGLLVAVGGILGGQAGLFIALVLAVVLNVGVYWFSDKLALRANGARPLQ